MGAQHFNFAAKLPEIGDIHSRIWYSWKKIFRQKVNFPTG